VRIFFFSVVLFLDGLNHIYFFVDAEFVLSVESMDKVIIVSFSNQPLMDQWAQTVTMIINSSTYRTVQPHAQHPAQVFGLFDVVGRHDSSSMLTLAFFFSCFGWQQQANNVSILIQQLVCHAICFIAVSVLHVRLRCVNESIVFFLDLFVCFSLQTSLRASMVGKLGTLEKSLDLQQEKLH